MKFFLILLIVFCSSENTQDNRKISATFLFLKNQPVKQENNWSYNQVAILKTSAKLQLIIQLGFTKKIFPVFANQFFTWVLPNNNKGQRGQRRKQKSNKSEPDKEKKFCNFCGGSWYNKLECPSRTEGVVCKVCKKQGHFERACLHPDTGKSTKSKTPVRKVKAC